MPWLFVPISFIHCAIVTRSSRWISCIASRDFHGNHPILLLHPHSDIFLHSFVLFLAANAHVYIKSWMNVGLYNCMCILFLAQLAKERKYVGHRHTGNFIEPNIRFSMAATAFYAFHERHQWSKDFVYSSYTKIDYCCIRLAMGDVKIKENVRRWRARTRQIVNFSFVSIYMYWRNKFVFEKRTEKKVSERIMASFFSIILSHHDYWENCFQLFQGFCLRTYSNCGDLLIKSQKKETKVFSKNLIIFILFFAFLWKRENNLLKSNFKALNFTGWARTF